MATLNKIIYDVREAYRLYSDDSDISNEYLAYQVNIARALLLEQKFSNRQYVIPQKIRQTFKMNLELAEGNELVSGISTVLRTKDPIQYPLEPYNFKSNMRVNSGSYDDSYFTLIDPSRFPYVGNNKWLQNQIYYTIGTDFRLYFTSSNPVFKTMEQIKLSMVCTNPEEAYPYTLYYDSNVDFEHSEYPFEENMITLLTDMIIKKLVVNLQSPEDKSNDSQNPQS